MLHVFGGFSAYTVITREPDRWRIFHLGYGEEMGLTRPELEAALDSIPHTAVPELGWGKPFQTGARVYSPDRRFYTTWENVDIFDRRQAVIYTRDEQLVAVAYKDRWFPYILGWAHDSSGVYFQLRNSIAATPEMPLFKLSPLTAEEARWQPIRAAAPWAGGILALGGGMWLWRRHRRRQFPH